MLDEFFAEKVSSTTPSNKLFPEPPPLIAVGTTSQYHLPDETPIVDVTDLALDVEIASFKLPSDNVPVLSLAFKVAKLLVQVSSVISVAARLVTAKWLSLPDVSAPIPLEFWLVPVCLNSK